MRVSEGCWLVVRSDEGWNRVVMVGMDGEGWEEWLEMEAVVSCGEEWWRVGDVLRGERGFEGLWGVGEVLRGGRGVEG